MPGFTTTDSGWVFRFDAEPKKPELPKEPGPATNYLAGSDRWANWSDPLLYECDSLARQFLESKDGDPQWSSASTRHRKFTMSIFFREIFGRDYDQKTDAKYVPRLTKVMAYYSTRIQKSGTVKGKAYNKTVYILSVSRMKKKPPYSLRLRLEWLEQHNELPTWKNMAPPKNDLEPGHARNKLTDENMERRRERARERYNERYGNRKH